MSQQIILTDRMTQALRSDAVCSSCTPVADETCQTRSRSGRQAQSSVAGADMDRSEAMVDRFDKSRACWMFKDVIELVIQHNVLCFCIVC